MTPLSASRIETLNECSWIYWSKYKLKVPDYGNDGSSRGSVCHLIYEVLANPRHEKHFKNIVKNGTCKICDSVWRLILKHAKVYKVDDEENLNLIDKMTLAGLTHDFFGKERGKLIRSDSELDFNIIVDEDDKRYCVRGFIDKAFFYENGDALIRDFKTSKEVFSGKKTDDNLQDLMYQLAVRKLFPEIKNIDMEFVFVKFDTRKEGLLAMEPVTQEELSGFEYQLTSIQEYIDNFSETDATVHFAAKQSFPKDGSFGGPLKCGKLFRSFKSGEAKFGDDGKTLGVYCCPYRLPRAYYSVFDENDKFIKSFHPEDLEKERQSLSHNFRIQRSWYEGCPCWVEKDKASIQSVGKDTIHDELKEKVKFWLD